MKKLKRSLIIALVILVLTIGVVILGNSLSARCNFCNIEEVLIYIDDIDTTEDVAINCEEDSDCIYIDVNEFYQIIKHSTKGSLLITKGDNYEGVVYLKNGDPIELIISKLYPVVRIRKNDKLLSYHINEAYEDKWFEFLRSYNLEVYPFKN